MQYEILSAPTKMPIAYYFLITSEFPTAGFVCPRASTDPHHIYFVLLITACVGDANEVKQVHERQSPKFIEPADKSTLRCAWVVASGFADIYGLVRIVYVFLEPIFCICILARCVCLCRVDVYLLLALRHKLYRQVRAAMRRVSILQSVALH